MYESFKEICSIGKKAEKICQMLILLCCVIFFFFGGGGKIRSGKWAICVSGWSGHIGKRKGVLPSVSVFLYGKVADLTQIQEPHPIHFLYEASKSREHNFSDKDLFYWLKHT